MAHAKPGDPGSPYAIGNAEVSTWGGVAVGSSRSDIAINSTQTVNAVWQGIRGSTVIIDTPATICALFD